MVLWEIQTFLALDVADDGDEDFMDILRWYSRNTNRPPKEIRKELLEKITKLDSIQQLQTKNESSLPQQTQEDSVSSYSEESIPKASDEVETACNYVQLTMEERSLPTPTLPITTNITSARTPAAGSSSPSRNSLQEVSHSHSHRSESIWQQILTKYGDITAKCGLTSPVFVAFVKQSILKIVELLQNNTARGLSHEKLSTIRCMLGDLELVQVEIGWLRTRYVAVEHLIDYAKAKADRDLILRRFLAKRAEVAELQVELDQAEAGLHELQQRVPDWLTAEDTLGKGLL